MKQYLFAALLALTVFARAQYTKLFDFDSPVTGANPREGSFFYDGTFLYGSATNGGAQNNGVAFKIKPDGTGFSKLIDFSGSGTGSGFQAPFFSDGTYLYSTTVEGGISHCLGGCGTIFKIKPDGSGYVKLFEFDTTHIGFYPNGKLWSDGTYLYGVTENGGGSNNCHPYTCGTIYKIRPDGTGFAIVHNFTGVPDGRTPNSSLIFDGTYLYGTTTFGGNGGSCASAFGCGTIYKIKPDGSGYATLFNFTGALTGANPINSLIFDGTFLYGTTAVDGSSDAGTIYKIKPDGTAFTKLYDFAGGGDGLQPICNMLLEGNSLYGLTMQGGGSTVCGTGCGTLFKIQTDGTNYTKLMGFSGSNGSLAAGPLVKVGTALYAATTQGGVHNQGTIFKYDIGSPATGIAGQHINEEISVFPNPFSSHLFVQSNSNFKNATVILYDLFGRAARKLNNVSGASCTIQRDDLPRGVYFLGITQDGRQILTTKVIATE